MFYQFKYKQMRAETLLSGIVQEIIMIMNRFTSLLLLLTTKY